MHLANRYAENLTPTEKKWLKALKDVELEELSTSVKP
jgi:hypothetical protein